jgi:hypothetical protein
MNTAMRIMLPLFNIFIRYCTGCKVLFRALTFGLVHVKFQKGQNIGVQNKVKISFTLERALKAQRGSRGIALLFL